MITIDHVWLTFLVGVVLPALVALVTRQVTSGAVKAVTLAVLSAVTGVLTSLPDSNGSFDLNLAFTNFVIAFTIAVVSHYGLLKPVGLTGSTGAIQENVPGGVV